MKKLILQSLFLVAAMVVFVLGIAHAGEASRGGASTAAPSDEVRAVAQRIIQSARNLPGNRLNKTTLINMVQAAFDGDNVDVASVIDFDALIGNQKTGGRPARSFAGDVLIAD